MEVKYTSKYRQQDRRHSGRYQTDG